MHESWTEEARSILDHACAWHGGADVYERVESISLTPGRLDGWLPSRKGLHRTFPLPRRMDVFPHDRCVVFVDYPDPGFDGVYDSGRVWIRHHGTHDVAVDSPDHHATFAGLGRYRGWDALDALCTLGGMIWRDHAVPFALADAEFLRLRSTAGARPLTIIEVEWPASDRPGGRRQAFYIDWAGRLQRYDDHVPAFGDWTRVAHVYRDYQRVDGLAVALDRRLVPRLGGWELPATLLRVTFTGVTIAGR